MPHPFWVGALLVDQEHPLLIKLVPGVVIMGNNPFSPSRGVPGPSPGAPSHQISPGRMYIRGKPLPGHPPHIPVPGHPQGVIQLCKHIYLVYTYGFGPGMNGRAQ